MFRNFKQFSSFFGIGMVVLLLAFSFNALFLPLAQAGIGDSIRGAIDRVKGSISGSPNLSVRITSAQVRGESLYINYTVENNGSADTPWRVPVEWDIYVNNERVGQDSLPQLREGALSRQSKAVTPRVWQKVNNIKIKMDPYNRISEGSENDNEDAYSVEKDIFTDLYIKGISFSKSPVTEGDKVTVNVEVENKGNTAAQSPKVEVIFNDKESKVIFPYRIEANSSEIIKVEFEANTPLVKIGRNKIGAWVEPATAYRDMEKMPLADHDATYLQVEEKPEPKPNFVIYGAVNPKYFEGPTELSIWFNIFNKGPRNDPDSPPTTAVLYVNNQRIKEFSVKALTPWIESAEFTHKYKIEKAGKYEIKVVVDEGNRIEEIKEDDNTYVYGTALDEFIDLEVSDLGIQTSTTLKEDGYVMVTPGVANKGTVRADSLVSVYLDREKVWGDTFRVEPNSSLSSRREVKVYVKGAGNHTLTVEAVPYSHHERLEKDKSNNKKDYNILILPPALPILKVDMISSGDPRIYLGQDIKMSFRVDNAGQGSSPSTYIRMLVNDRVQEDFRLNELRPGANEQFKYAFTPDRIGAYRIMIMVNPEGADVRRGNVKYNHVGYTVDVVEELKPNLKLEFTDYGPPVIYTGEKIKASFRVTNRGKAGSPPYTYARLLINGKVEKDFVIGGMKPGGYQPFSYEKEINQAGTYAVEIRINPEGEDVRRSGVKYDHIGFSSDVKEKPKVIDPAIEKLEVNKTTLEEGEDVRISLYVNNYGNETDSVLVQIMLDGKTVGMNRDLALTPNKTVPIGKSVAVKGAGKHVVSAQVSASRENKDKETKIDNNYKEIEVIVEAEKFIDLAVGDIEVSPASVKVGEEISIRFPFGNLGNQEARAAVGIEYNGRQIHVESGYLPPHTRIGSRVVEKKFKVEEAGTFTIKGFISPNTSYKDLEKNESNNTKERKITVVEAGFIDLVVEGLELDKTTVREGERINLEVRVNNYGSIDDAGKVLIKVDDELIISEEVDFRLRKQVVIKRNPAITAKPGGHIIKAEAVSSKNAELEKVPRNNSREIKINVEDKRFIDLRLSYLHVSNSKPTDGETVEAIVGVTNDGNTLAPADVRVMFDKSRTFNQRLSVHGGQTETFKQKIQVQGAGKHVISARAIPAPSVQDLEEKTDNNYREFDIEVAQEDFIDLAVEDLGLAHASIMQGQDFILNPVIRNKGNISADSVRFLIIIDGKTQASPMHSVGKINPGAVGVERNVRVKIEDVGRHKIGILAQAYRQEKYEAQEVVKDNSREVEVEVQKAAFIDLEITGFEVEPQSVEAEGEIILKTRVKNKGNVTSAAGASLYRAINGDYAGSSRGILPKIEPGEDIAHQMRIKAPAEGGSYTITMKVEPHRGQKDLEAEEYQKNNTKDSSVKVKGVDTVPVITSFSRKEAGVGESVMLYGKNLYLETGGELKVVFNGAQTTRVGMFPGGEKLNVMVPQGAKTGKVKVIINGKASNELDFTIVEIKPEIRSIYPQAAEVGDTIDVTGKNLIDNVKERIAKFGNVQTRDVNVFRGYKLMVKVPQGAKSGKFSLVIDGKETNAVDFTLKDLTPVIERMEPEEVREGGLIVLYGKNLYGKNIAVHFKGGRSTDLGRFTNGLKLNVGVPSGAKSGKMYVVVDGRRSNEVDFKLKEIVPVIERLDPEQSKPQDKMVVLHGKNLYGTGRDIVAYFEGAQSTNLGRFTDGTKLNVGLPAGVKSGKLYVVIDGKKSNEVDFKLVELFPEITRIDPPESKPGDKMIVLYGSNLYGTGKDIVAHFEGAKSMNLGRFTDGTKLNVGLPAGVKSGKLYVTIDGKRSNTVDFKMKEIVPVIERIEPERAEPGSMVVLYGSNLYGTGRDIVVHFEGAQSTNLGRFTDGTKLNVGLPAGARSGKLYVVIDGKKSNEVDFVLKTKEEEKKEEKINLEVQSVELSSYTPAKMETVRLTAIIYNASDEPVEGIKWNFNMQDHYNVTYDVDEIIPKKSRKRVTTAFLAREIGKYKIEVKVLPPQGKENTASADKQVKECYVNTGMVNLEMREVTVSNETPEEMETITLNAVIYNAGDSPVEGVKWVFFMQDHYNMTYDIKGSIPAKGEERVRTAFLARKVGKYKANVSVVAPQNSQNMADEPKQKKEFFITTGTRKSNLEMRSVELSNYEPAKMETVRLNAVIYNASDKPVVGVKWVFNMQNHYNVTYDVSGSIPAKSEKRVTTAFLARDSGKFKIDVKVLPIPGTENIAAADKQVKECYVTTGGLPSVKLEMKSLELSNYTPKKMETVRLTAVIFNHQDVPIEGVKWEFDMQDHYNVTYDVGRIGAGEEKKVKTAFLARELGKYKITAKIIPPQGKENSIVPSLASKECYVTTGEEKEAKQEAVDLAIQKLDISLNKPPFTVLKGAIILPDGADIMIDGRAINLGKGEAKFTMAMKLDEEVIMKSMSPGTAVPNEEIAFSKTVKVEGLGQHIIKVAIMPTSEYKKLEENEDNNIKEVRIMVKQGAAAVSAADFSQVKAAVDRLYSEFKSSYSNADVNGVLRCIDKEWESSGGQSFYDLSSRLSNIFSTFTQLRVEMSGFSVSNSEDPDYAARVDYFIKIDGALFYNPSIKHHEEGQVTEYIKKVRDKYLIGKTVGKGAF